VREGIDSDDVHVRYRRPRAPHFTPAAFSGTTAGIDVASALPPVAASSVHRRRAPRVPRACTVSGRGCGALSPASRLNALDAGGRPSTAARALAFAHRSAETTAGGERERRAVVRMFGYECCRTGHGTPWTCLACGGWRQMHMSDTGRAAACIQSSVSNARAWPTCARGRRQERPFVRTACESGRRPDHARSPEDVRMCETAGRGVGSSRPASTMIARCAHKAGRAQGPKRHAKGAPRTR
jgi:hypothetical protein